MYRNCETLSNHAIAIYKSETFYPEHIFINRITALRRVTCRTAHVGSV